jgi:hypothetical protein
MDMRIKKLLFVTKFEELGYDALETLLSLRRAFLEHIVFLYVIERDKVAMQRGVGFKRDEAIRQRSGKHLLHRLGRTLLQGMEVWVHRSAWRSKSPRRSKRGATGRSRCKIDLSNLFGVTVMSYPQTVRPRPGINRRPSSCLPPVPFDRPLLATDGRPRACGP